MKQQLGDLTTRIIIFAVCFIPSVIGIGFALCNFFLAWAWQGADAAWRVWVGLILDWTDHVAGGMVDLAGFFNAWPGESFSQLLQIAQTTDPHALAHLENQLISILLFSLLGGLALAAGISILFQKILYGREI